MKVDVVVAGAFNYNLKVNSRARTESERMLWNVMLTIDYAIFHDMRCTNVVRN